TVPLVASSLCLLPYLRTVLPPERPIGVLTFDGPKLAGTLGLEETASLAIEGIETGSELHPVISQDCELLDIDAARRDVAEAAQRLAARAPDLAAVVLECTNLPPYRDVIDPVFPCRVYDIRDIVLWHAGAAPL
ncbi:MAG: aspartate/glutamate racemase family protein, partial [Hyphomicrobiales bacterium]